MTACGYPGLDNHRQVHQLLLKQVEIATGRLTGVEALVRRQHPERGLPVRFTDIPEKNSLANISGTLTGV